MSKYDYGIELPEGGSIRWGYDAIPENSRVLEMGCAEGLLTRHLKIEKNCIVDVVEIDEVSGKHAEEYAQTALLGMGDGNLETNRWFEKLKDNRYDVITLLDVLEHLRNPEEVLKKSAELLTENGYICVSVPNIGHNSVLINLLNDKFEYQDLGILDNTHIRFFCQETLEKMVNECGLIAVEKQYSRAQVGETIIDNDYNQINSGVANALKLRKNGELFQFMYKLEPNKKGKKEGELNYKSEISTLFYDLGEGFLQENAIQAEYGVVNQVIQVQFDTSHLSGVKGYRWDPIEIGGHVIDIAEFKVGSANRSVDVKIVPQNAMLSMRDRDLFITNDPVYLTEGDVSQVTSIEIEARIKVIDNEDIQEIGQLVDRGIRTIDEKQLEINEKQSEINEKQSEINEKQSEINEMHISYQKELDVKNEEILKYNNNEKALYAEIENLKQQIYQVTTSYNIVTNSTFWKITKPARVMLDLFKKMVDNNRYARLSYKALKSLKNDGIRATAKKTKNKIKNRNAVKAQMEMSINLEMKERERQSNQKFSKDVVFSIVVPLYNTPENLLTEMIESIQKQTYSKWELCMADGSDVEHSYVGEICAKYIKKDSRIKYNKLEKNLGISDNTNACLDMATGDYIGLFDHDDLLHPSVLFYYMHEICDHDADFIYCDELTFEDRIDNPIIIHFKPDFAIDNLRANNYICHFTVFSRELMEKVGKFNSQYDGSQDYDMILRLTEQAKCIKHIPKILYYWRAHANSVASDISAKMYTIDAAKEALTAHLERCGLRAEIMDAHETALSWYRMKYEITGNPLVSILIPNKDSVAILKQCIDSIVQKSTYENYEIVVVENNSTEEETFAYYKELEQDDRIKIVTWEHEFNYSKINNFGYTHCNGDYIVLLNNDIEVITENWIEEMLMLTQRNDVGAVGAMLYYPNDTIQHAGIIMGLGGVAGHSHKYFPRGHVGYMRRLQYVQNLSGVTAACLMVKRSVYDELNGLDEGFAVAFNDVDFCMRIREAGHLICWTPFAELYHHESISRGHEDTPEKQARFKGEIDRFQARWGEELKVGDPYYNVNLTLDREDFSFK